MSLTTHQLRGFTVTVNNTRPDIATAEVITRLERALGALQLADQEVAPEIDWQLAQQRVAEADRKARRGV